MNKEYKVEKEYSLAEIVRYNLRMWWLAVILAVICAAALGGYKYTALHQFVEDEIYENKQQVVSTLYVAPYSDGASVERVNNIAKIAKSNKAYENFCQITGTTLELEEYKSLFDTEKAESSDVTSFYVTFPANYGDYSIMDEEAGKAFMKGIIEATTKTCEDMLGANCVTVIDAPYATSEVIKLDTYSISKEDFKKGVLKAVTAGVLLGIIVEVVCFTFWMLLYKKPKDAEEVRASLDTEVIDVLKTGADTEEAFRKVTFFLEDKEVSCNKISCVSVQCPKKDVALKLAMSCANQQKKTLYIDLAANESAGEQNNSISQFVLGEKEEVKPLQMNAYLDSLSRDQSAEKGMDIVGSKRFAKLLEEMGKGYECIVVNSADVIKSADAFTVSKLCNKTMVICGRKTVTDEALYRTKNTLDVNNIHTDGVLVYEL